jgi:hypothetical protein
LTVGSAASNVYAGSITRRQIMALRVFRFEHTLVLDREGCKMLLNRKAGARLASASFETIGAFVGAISPILIAAPVVGRPKLMNT